MFLLFISPLPKAGVDHLEGLGVGGATSELNRARGCEMPSNGWFAMLVWLV